MSKEPIDLVLVNIDQIAVSDKFSNNGSKYFIGSQEGEIVKTIMYYFTSNDWVYKILWIRRHEHVFFN